MKILFINSSDKEFHKNSSNSALYPHLGLLTLMTGLSEELRHRGIDCELGYFDGCLYGNDILKEYIVEHGSTIAATCFSVLTSTHAPSLDLARFAKRKNPNIITVFGNDHFSALYERVMRLRQEVDYGFYGNDVVFGFSRFMADLLEHRLMDMSTYAGLVYRQSGHILKNDEDPTEYNRLPLVDYTLCDGILPHTSIYLQAQKSQYSLFEKNDYRGQVIDIGRGCIKFSGKRKYNVPSNACDFCGIVPGARAVASAKSEVAWERIRNAYEQGFNYLYITADELPLTFWPLLKKMAETQPDWFTRLKREERPKMFGYARAEAFERCSDKIDVLVNVFGLDNFFIGFDGLSNISLKALNKQSTIRSEATYGLMQANIDAINVASSCGCLITGGVVLTHLGITKAMMEENFAALETMLAENPKLFTAMDFSPHCPIPGSLSFHYFVDPDFASWRASQLNLQINKDYLESTTAKYSENDIFEIIDMENDFLKGCCPDIDRKYVDEQLDAVTAMAERFGIVVGGTM